MVLENTKSIYLITYMVQCIEFFDGPHVGRVNVGIRCRYHHVPVGRRAPRI